MVHEQRRDVTKHDIIHDRADLDFYVSGTEEEGQLLAVLACRAVE